MKLADRLPRLPRHWGGDFEPRLLSVPEVRLMSLSRLRAPGAARKLELRSQMSIDALADTLPVPRWQRRNRIKALLGRTLRLKHYDPFRQYAPKRRRGERRPYTPT